MTFVEKILAVVTALRDADIPFGIGGALALGYHVGEPRTTVDIDVNVSVPTASAERVLAALPGGIPREQKNLDQIKRDGQTRLYWDDDATPVDLFFPQHSIHDDVSRDTIEVSFAGTTIPIVSADHLAVFKVMFDRPKDWADLQAMVDEYSVDRDRVTAYLGTILGPDDRRIGRFSSLRPQYPNDMDTPKDSG